MFPHFFPRAHATAHSSSTNPWPRHTSRMTACAPMDGSFTGTGALALSEPVLSLPLPIDRLPSEAQYIKTLYWRCMALQNRMDRTLCGASEVPEYWEHFSGANAVGYDIQNLENALGAVEVYGTYAESLHAIALNAGTRIQRRCLTTDFVKERTSSMGCQPVSNVYECLLQVQRCIERAAAADGGNPIGADTDVALSHTWAHFHAKLRDYLRAENYGTRLEEILTQETDSLYRPPRSDVLMSVYPPGASDDPVVVE